MKSLLNVSAVFFVLVCSLCSNQLGDKGTMALAEALTVNHTLLSLQSVQSAPSVTLELQMLLISDAVCQVIRDRLCLTLSFDRLQSNSISNRGMTALTKALRLNLGLVSLK